MSELGCNATRMSHNPAAPELMDLADSMGFLVIAEIFDTWEHAKAANDFHLIFPDWHEPDIRAFIRRDRNHPSIIAWSFGNEVAEQLDGESGAAVAMMLCDIVHSDSSLWPAIAPMNWAKPNETFSQVVDLILLNYQGEGIRDTAA